MHEADHGTKWQRSRQGTPPDYGGGVLRSACVLLGSLIAATASADELRVENKGSTYPLTDLTLDGFAVPGGRFVEVGLCSARRPGRVSSYACMSLDVGKQDGEWIVGEVVEWGLRVRVSRHVSIKAAGGFSLLTLFVNGIACAFGSAEGAGADGPSDAPSTETCGGGLLPMQAYPTLGAQVTIPTSRIDLVVAGNVRYIVPIEGRVDVRAPSGLAVSLGAGVAF
jgi:hypothetical protein